MRRATLLLTLLTACGARSELVTPLDASVPPRNDAESLLADTESLLADTESLLADTVLESPDAVLESPDAVLVSPDAVLVSPDVVQPPPRCGNGVLEAGEACDIGALNALVPAFQYAQPGAPPVALRPVVRRGGIVGFYDYRSASAHTGYEVARAANILVYANALDGALGIALFAGVDGDAQPDGDLRATLLGVPQGAVLAVSDDADEFTRDGSGTFRGRWNFRSNTDGGAITNLPWNTPWRITAQIEYRLGVSAVRVVDGRMGPVGLSTRAEIVLEHFTIATACRPDCREPRCGDGYLDAGERCDDGNRTDGDGCGADCLRLQ